MDGECLVCIQVWLLTVISIQSGATALTTQPQNVVSVGIITAAIKEHQEGSTMEDESECW